MSKALVVGQTFEKIGNEIIAKDVVGKIDWSKIVDLLIQVLPLILALFSEKETRD